MFLLANNIIHYLTMVQKFYSSIILYHCIHPNYLGVAFTGKKEKEKESEVVNCKINSQNEQRRGRSSDGDGHE